MTTTLDPSFLRAVCLLVSFKPKAMIRAQAALLLIGLQHPEFTAADLPAEVVVNKHISGAATGALIAQGLLQVCGRVKSTHPSAKGRKLDLLQLRSRELARAWLRANHIQPPPAAEQPCLPDFPENC